VQVRPTGPGPALPDLHMGLWPKNRISTRVLGFGSAFQFWAAEGTQTEQKQRRGTERGDRDWRERAIDSKNSSYPAVLVLDLMSIVVLLLKIHTIKSCAGR
jgi:hypothetical protein